MAVHVFIDDKEIKEKLEKKLIKMQSKIDSIKGGKKEKEFHGAVSALVFADVVDHFEKEQGSDGKWQKWSASYQAAIDGTIFFRNVGGRSVAFNTADAKDPPPPPRKPGQILQDTGNLRQGFKPSNYKISGSGISWFNDAKTRSGFPYAFAHNEGGNRLPKRDFMWLSEKSLEKISEATIEYILPKKDK